MARKIEITIPTKPLESLDIQLDVGDSKMSDTAIISRAIRDLDKARAYLEAALGDSSVGMVVERNFEPVEVTP